MNLLTAAAAAALLASPAAFAQYGGQNNGQTQTDVPSTKHMNSAHANAPSSPDQTNSGTQGPRGMQDTSAGQSPGGDNDMNGGAMRSNRDRDDRMGTSDRMRVRENGRGNLRITTTQRTRIRDVIVRAHGPRLTHVNFRVGVGARVPRSVRIAVLPPEIVAIAPEWQGYSYFEYGNQIVVVDPATFAIVATLPL